MELIINKVYRHQKIENGRKMKVDLPINESENRRHKGLRNLSFNLSSRFSSITHLSFICQHPGDNIRDRDIVFHRINL